jgi:BirA family biotin operon repressor/biotin-[acetyl-CoA-carboxylase] ligase
MSSFVKVVSVDWHESVDSTSRLARDFLASKLGSLGAFAAREQTAGLGRQGRRWLSPAGNLYLSVVVPAEMIPPEIRGLIPHAAALAVAAWIFETYSLKPLIKWPNDIVIDGRKVAGILCEASSVGSTFGGCIVGIGVNLDVAPDISLEGVSYSSISMLQATGQSRPPRSSADGLASMLLHYLTKSSVSDLMRDYQDYATRASHMWFDVHNRGRILKQEPFEADGALRLRDSEGQVNVIVSSEHSLTPMAVMPKRILVADIGNTRVKFALVSVGFASPRFFQVDEVLSCDPKDEHTLTEDVKAWLHKFETLPKNLSIISVNDLHTAKVMSCAKKLGLEARVLAKRAVRLNQSAYNLSEIGMDRFCALEALLTMRSRGEISGPVIIASFGTATTIDFVGADGHHVGGLIGVGVTTSLRGLSQFTGRLPDLVEASSDFASDSSTDIGIDTKSAMLQASYRMQAAWIHGERKQFAKRLGENITNVNIICAGGHAAAVCALLRLEESYDPVSLQEHPHLAACGAAILALHQ